MRDQLKQYINLLFAGAADCEDIQQEILQNTLDRYDDLIAEGKVPEAAYRLAITGIGDISEILGVKSQTVPVPQSTQTKAASGGNDIPLKKLLRAIAIGLYIISFIPLIVLSEFKMELFGLCCTIVIVAMATVMLILCGKKDTPAKPQKESLTPQQELNKSIGSLIGVVALAVYLIVSFTSGAWFITWLIFPIAGAAKRLVKAILDLKEAQKHEI